LFGWAIGPGVGDYQAWVTDGQAPWAGLMPAGEVPAGHWVPYVVVADLDAAVKQALALGASVIKDKTLGPAGTSVTVSAPDGAPIALFSPAPAG
jgi:predicted enzyme related to lactoylglutathione lyase